MSSFHPINKRDSAILDRLMDGLAVGESRKFDSGRGYMPLHVERLYGNVYSLAHYFKQNGDLVPDPDMEILRGADGRWYPLATQFAIGAYIRSAELGEDGSIRRLWPGRQRDAASFAGMWLRNIREQQEV